MSATNREPRSPIRDELGFYFVEAKAFGVHCTLGASGARLSEPESRALSGLHDGRGRHNEFDSDATREREIHAAFVQLEALHQNALRARYEPRRWPRDVWAWGDLVGVIMLTDEAHKAFADATAPKGKRRVWREVAEEQDKAGFWYPSGTLLPFHVTAERMSKVAGWLEASDAPAFRRDGLLDWLGRDAVRTNKDLGKALREAATGLLGAAEGAYGAARGWPSAEQRKAGATARVYKWEAPKVVLPARVFA
jgi:hypothetical protein